jgi:hypothetical protein
VVSDALSHAGPGIERIRKGVVQIKRSPLLTSALRQINEDEGNAGKRLILDVVTRWNSKLHMLRAAISNRVSFVKAMQIVNGVTVEDHYASLLSNDSDFDPDKVRLVFMALLHFLQAVQ